jgi:DNA-binding beta-propeller fold protein YncE
MRPVLLSLALAGLAALSACSSSEEGCARDSDCPADQTCVPRTGACVSVGTDAGADAGVVPADSGAEDDAGPLDTGVPVDAGVEDDAGTPVDVGPRPDAGVAPVRLTFPPTGAVTQADRITVRGVARPGTAVRGLRINGVAATSADNFATFRAEVPLTLGQNDLRFNVDDGVSTADYAVGGLERQDVLLMAPRDMDRVGSTVYVVDSALNRLVSIDTVAGTRRVRSGPTVGAGPSLNDPRGVVVTADGMTAYVVSMGSAAVMRVDLASGDRSELSGSSAGSGPVFDTPRRLAFDLARSRLLVADTGNDTLYAVALTTGARTVLSDSATGAGPGFGSPRDVVVDTAGQRALVADSSAAALFSVDLLTGDRTVLQGAGPSFVGPRGVAVTADGRTAYLADGDQATLFQIDLASGARTVVSDPVTGRGPWADPRRVLLADDGAPWVLDYITDAVVRVALATGDRSVLAASPAGVGAHFGGPFGISVSSDPSAEVLVSDAYFEQLFAVDLVTGTRRVLSGDGEAGPNLNEPFGVAHRGAAAVVVDTALSAALTVDLATGSREYLSNAVISDGPAFDAPRDVVVAPDGRLWVVDSVEDAVFAVDPTDGARTVVSQEGTGAGLIFLTPYGVDRVDEDHLVVADSGLGAIVQVTLPLGDRAILAGAGTALQSPRGVAVAPDGALYVTDLGLQAVLRMEPGTHDTHPVASAAAGRGPELSAPAHLAWHPDGYLLVVDENDVLFAVDPVSGDRVYASK